MSDPSSIAQSSSRFSRQSVIRILKITLTMLVICGVVLAADRAVDQWDEATATFRDQADAIETSLNDAIAQNQSPDTIAALRSELDVATARIPSLDDFRWNRLAVAGLLYGLALLPPGWLLGSLVLALGANVRRSNAMAAQLIGHLGKYIPGKVAVVVMRAGVMAGDGVPAMTSSIAVFVETFLMMAVGSAIASVVLVFLVLPPWLVTLAIIMAIGVGIPTWPPVLSSIAAKLTPANREDLRRQITWPVIAKAWAWMSLSWALMGGSFMMILMAVPSVAPLPSAPQLYPVATAAIALSMAVGFASLLPGGVGVRELVLLTIVSVATDPAHATFAAIAARFVFMAAEILIAGGIWAARKIFMKASREPATMIA